MLHFKPGAEQIPGYRLVRFLGKGQFGQVWETTAPGGGAAALKFLDLSGKQGWKEFRGIQRVKQLRHANLMPITALWLLDDEGTILDEDQVRTVIDEEQESKKTVVPTSTDQSQPRWLVVAQLLGEGTLADELEKCQQRGEKGIPVDRLLNYMDEAAKGIDYLNAANRDLGEGIFAVQHCDIKPANVLLLGGSALVCDFGVAQVLMDASAQARATGMTGSPAYMPPECGLGTPSPTSDQYSLAVSYFELRTGELPFEVQTPMAVLDAHRTGKLALDKLPKAERAVIRKATSVDPNKRYSDCQTMVEALRETIHRPVHQPTSRTRAILMAVLAGILLAVLVTRIPSLIPTRTTYTIRVTPIDSSVTVNGDPVQVVDGVARVSLEPEQPGQIVVSHGSDFQVVRQPLEVLGRDPKQPIEITLQHSASYWATDAIELVETDLEKAVDSYINAIQTDAAYAQFPQPIALNGKTEGAELRPIACTKDGHWLVGVGAKGEVHGWDISQNQIANPRTLHQYDGKVRCISVGQTWIVSADENGQIVATPIVANAGTKKSISWPPGVDALAMRADDQVVLIADANYALHRWTLQDAGSFPTKIGEHQDSVDKIVIAENPAIAYSASWDDTVGKWPLDPTGTSAAPFFNSEGGIETIAAASDRFAVADRNQVKVSGHDQANFTTLPAKHSDAIGVLAFHPDGKRLAVGSEDGKVSILKSAGGAEPWTELPIPNQHVDHAVNSLVFDPTSHLLFSASDDRSLVAWDTEAARYRSAIVFRGSSSITAVCVSPNGRWLFCESADGTVRAWDLRVVKTIKRAAERARVQTQPAPPRKQVVEA